MTRHISNRIEAFEKHHRKPGELSTARNNDDGADLAYLKLYHVVACTGDGESMDWNVLATCHQDAFDRLIEFRARGFFNQPQGPISRQAIAAADWDCDGIRNREQDEVVVWEVRLDQPDPMTGCIPWDSSNNGVEEFLPDVLASLGRRNALI